MPHQSADYDSLRAALCAVARLHAPAGAVVRNDVDKRNALQDRYRAGMGSNDALCTVHELAVGPSRQNQHQIKYLTIPGGEGQLRKPSKVGANWLSVLTDKTVSKRNMQRYRAGMGSNDALCTVHELAVGPNRQNRHHRSGAGRFQPLSYEI